MKRIFLSLIFASALMGGSVFASQEPTSNLHCKVDKITVTTWDLFQMPAGTQQEIRFLELRCDEETFGPNQHEAFVTAPLSLLRDLQQKQQSGIKSVYTVTLAGYAGNLVAIDGREVGPLQPTARPGSNFDYRREEIYDPSSLVSQIYLQNCKNCNGQVALVGHDAPLFRVIASISRRHASSNGDGRGTPGIMHAFLIFQGSVGPHQNPGDALQLSPRDSLGLSSFLLMTKFPASVSLSKASIVCSTANNCSLIQESKQ